MRGGCVPAVPAYGARPVGRQDSHASAGCRDDYGLDRHIQLEFDPKPSPPYAGLVGGNGRHSCGGGGDARSFAWGDRKSVVEGKSVSVRVDLGGRGYSKQKNRTQ